MFTFIFKAIGTTGIDITKVLAGIDTTYMSTGTNTRYMFTIGMDATFLWKWTLHSCQEGI
jgi:hypothetical protein